MTQEKDITDCMLVDFVDGTIFHKYTSSKSKESNVKTLDGKNRHSFGYGYFHVPPGRLSICHVNNMLHVLAGLRPKPTFRESEAQLDNSITEIAKRSRIKIYSPIVNGDYIWEITSARKANNDCFKTAAHYITLNGEAIKMTGVLSKEKVKMFLGCDMFNEFEKIARNIVLDYDLLSIEEIVEKLNYTYNNDKVIGNQILEFAQKCARVKRTDFYNLLMGKKVPSGPLNVGFNRQYKTYANYGSPEKITKISGTIYVPISKDELDFFRRGIGFATILGGGIASIEGIESMSENLVLDAQYPYDPFETHETT